MSGFDCIILAAGNSLRMGQCKLLLPYGKSAILERVVETALQCSGRVILVTGFGKEPLEELFTGNPRVISVYNKDWEKGMFSSARLGMSLVQSDRFFLSLGDMPKVTKEVYEQLLTYPVFPSVIPQYLGKKGHPVLFSSEVLPFALNLKPEDSLRQVISRYPSLIVPSDNSGILQDIDTPEDYSALVEGNFYR